MDDIGTLIFWGALCWLFCVAFHYWATNPRLSLNWEDDEPDVTAGYSRYTESHLRLIKGDYDLPPFEEQAFALDYEVRGGDAA